jgi:hypothetical protein
MDSLNPMHIRVEKRLQDGVSSELSPGDHAESKSLPQEHCVHAKGGGRGFEDCTSRHNLMSV